MDRIALSGVPYSGKSTIVAALVKNHGYMEINYSNALKSLVAKSLNAVGVEATVEDIVREKRKYRVFLQEFGNVIGWSDDVKYVEWSLYEWRTRGCPSAVFDNVRTVEQFEALKKFGFRLVEVKVPAMVQRNRASLHGVSAEEFAAIQVHPIEQGVGSYNPDLVELWLDGRLPPEKNAELIAGHRVAEV